ncbi:uncharacterized protein LOC110366537 [Fundulus heteroclitus]|uniref:uncharacterized protein LOC110366537 n=1 Tax=Fundulus heteroclitus TaxID=8078 RepID=UPI00165AC21E|nr:uncharacterized protein LOC110366537 [Fundulus heteroclitus]
MKLILMEEWRWKVLPLFQIKSRCFLYEPWIVPTLQRRMKVAGVLLVLSVTLGAARGQKAELDLVDEAERTNTRECANLTLVLDNWKYAIMTQVKDLLLHDHNTVLPDYGRIQPLSEALGNLYVEFNSLKERLVELTARFEDVESFVDDVRSGKKTGAQSSEILRWSTRDEGTAKALY